MFLERIESNKLSTLDENTKELVKEFHSAINAKYPNYNAAMLLFRPLLLHFTKDYSIRYYNRIEKFPNFEKAINYLNDELNLKNWYYNLLLDIKNIVNEINHDFKVLCSGDEEIIENTWDFIKWMVETQLQ